jgi:hypothetical protein
MPRLGILRRVGMDATDRGVHARACGSVLFFFANLSFYLVMAMFTQKGCIFRRCTPAWSSCPWRSPS